MSNYQSVTANGNESMLDIAAKYTGDSSNAEMLIDLNGFTYNLIDFLPSGEWVAIPKTKLLPAYKTAQNTPLTVEVTGYGSTAPVPPAVPPDNNKSHYLLLAAAALFAVLLITNSNKDDE